MSIKNTEDDPIQQHWNFTNFLSWEAASRDTLDVKRSYIDAAGDVLAGIVLSEIVYWHLPDKQGHSKLRVTKKDKDGLGYQEWIAVRRYEWWDRTRMTPEQADYALRKLVKRGLIEKKVFKFDGSPTVHVRLLKDAFLATMQAILTEEQVNPYLPETMPDLQNGNGKFPKSNWEKTGKPLTKTTTDKTPSPARNASSVPDFQKQAAESLYRSVRPKHITLPRTDQVNAAFEVLQLYLDKFGSERQAADALRPFAQEADRRGISQTNLCWLTEWAAAGSIPPQKKSKNQPPGRRSSDRRQSGSAALRNDPSLEPPEWTPEEEAHARRLMAEEEEP